jgi:hypothetical protein
LVVDVVVVLGSGALVVGGNVVVGARVVVVVGACVVVVVVGACVVVASVVVVVGACVVGACVVVVVGNDTSVYGVLATVDLHVVPVPTSEGVPVKYKLAAASLHPALRPLFSSFPIPDDPNPKIP